MAFPPAPPCCDPISALGPYVTPPTSRTFRRVNSILELDISGGDSSNTRRASQFYTRGTFLNPIPSLPVIPYFPGDVSTPKEFPPCTSRFPLGPHVRFSNAWIREYTFSFQTRPSFQGDVFLSQEKSISSFWASSSRPFAKSFP